MPCLQNAMTTCSFRDAEGICPPCRGRQVIATLFGGNVLTAPNNYKLDFDAQRFFDRGMLADALEKEFKLLVEEEELPDTFGGLDVLCLKIVREPEKRALARQYIYRA